MSLSTTKYVNSFSREHIPGRQANSGMPLTASAMTVQRPARSFNDYRTQFQSNLTIDTAAVNFLMNKYWIYGLIAGDPEIIVPSDTSEFVKKFLVEIGSPDDVTLYVAAFEARQKEARTPKPNRPPPAAPVPAPASSPAVPPVFDAVATADSAELALWFALEEAGPRASSLRMQIAQRLDTQAVHGAIYDTLSKTEKGTWTTKLRAKIGQPEEAPPAEAPAAEAAEGSPPKATTTSPPPPKGGIYQPAMRMPVLERFVRLDSDVFIGIVVKLAGEKTIGLTLDALKKLFPREEPAASNASAAPAAPAAVTVAPSAPQDPASILGTIGFLSKEGTSGRLQHYSKHEALVNAARQQQTALESHHKKLWEATGQNSDLCKFAKAELDRMKGSPGEIARFQLPVHRDLGIDDIDAICWDIVRRFFHGRDDDATLFWDELLDMVDIRPDDSKSPDELISRFQNYNAIFLARSHLVGVPEFPEPVRAALFKRLFLKGGPPKQMLGKFEDVRSGAERAGQSVKLDDLFKCSRSYPAFFSKGDSKPKAKKEKEENGPAEAAFVASAAQPPAKKPAYGGGGGGGGGNGNGGSNGGGKNGSSGKSSSGGKNNNGGDGKHRGDRGRSKSWDKPKHSSGKDRNGSPEKDSSDNKSGWRRSSSQRPPSPKYARTNSAVADNDEMEDALKEVFLKVMSKAIKSLTGQSSSSRRSSRDSGSDSDDSGSGQSL